MSIFTIKTANMKKKIVIHYDEIALKGKNRKNFENQLVKNLNFKFSEYARAKLGWGRIFLEPKDDTALENIISDLALFPGISNYGLALSAEKDKDELCKATAELCKNISGSFRISAKRVDKSFAISSPDLEKELGACALSANKDLKVDLKNFEHEIRVEILHDEAIVFINKRGLGGLAVGSSGKSLALLSAGFDSPVASFLMAKRGAKIDAVHFHSYPKTSKDAIEATKELAKKLSNISLNLDLYLVPVLDVQKHIAMNSKERLRIILLRRFMTAFANILAEKIGALSLVTGESLGQVASQTMENILATNSASTLPILRPLIGMNKSEIIELSRKLGFYEYSSRPCDDTCSLFLPKNPETKAKLDELIEHEQNLQLEQFYPYLESKTEKISFKNGELKI